MFAELSDILKHQGNAKKTSRTRRTYYVYSRTSPCPNDAPPSLSQESSAIAAEPVAVEMGVDSVDINKIQGKLDPTFSQLYDRSSATMS